MWSRAGKAEVMNIDEIIWILSPILVGLLIEISSVYLSVKRTGKINLLFTILILAFSIFSIVVLIQMFFGGYPSYLPHAIILLAGLILLFQKIALKK